MKVLGVFAVVVDSLSGEGEDDGDGDRGKYGDGSAGRWWQR